MKLEEGDVIELVEGYTVYADVPEHFLYSNRKGIFKFGHGEVTIRGELSYLAGTYIVYKTTMGGGGTAHGPGDIYPDGHHVFCIRLYDHTVRVDFYQSGAFRALLPDVKVKARAAQQWSIKTGEKNEQSVG